MLQTCRFNNKYRLNHNTQNNLLEDEIREYLNTTPSRYQTSLKVRSLCESLVPFNLSKSELLQIVNLMPQSLVELYLIISNIEDRLDEQKIQELSSLIKKHL